MGARAVAVALVVSAVCASPASAEVFSNTAPISFTQLSGENTRWSTYPTTIEVSGAPRLVTRVIVGLMGYRRNDMDDDDMLLVGPNGQRVMLLSDAGSQGSSGAPVNVFLDDQAPSMAPDEAFFGTGEVRYRPSDYAPIDEPLLSPAPATPAARTSLGGAFGGSNPNGTWRLFMASDSTFSLGPRYGALDGGWQIELETAPLVTPAPSPAATSPPPASTPATPIAVAAPLPVPPDRQAPTLSRLRLDARFATRGRGSGTALTYRLDESAVVRFTVERLRPGRRRIGRCVTLRTARTGPRCTRASTLPGSIARRSDAGANSVRFTGRIAGRTLPAGTYRLRAVPRDAAGNDGKPQTRRFSIARR